MQKIKIFKSVESELEMLEADVNQWIEQSGAKLVNVVGNIAPQTSHHGALDSFSVSDILLIITYEDGRG